MPLEPKAQLVDPQGPLDVDGVNATGITTATGGFVGNIQGSATGLASTTINLTAGIITATRFIGDVTGTASSLNRGANITVGVMTATFVGDLLGNATGLTTTTSNLNLGIVTSTGFRGNFTGLSSGLSGTPNIQTGITTATKFIGNSTGTVVDLADDTNINVGIITATKFEGNTTGSVTDLADDTNINVGIITASKFIGNANGSVTGLADDVNVAASTFTGTKFVGNTPGSVSDIADDTNLNMGTLTGTKFEGNTTGSVSAIADDTNLNLGTLTASQFIGNTPGNAAGISAAQNIAGGTITATTFHGNGAALTGAGSTAFIRQTVVASSSGTINLNLGNVVYLTHDANVTISFSNVPTATQVTIIRSITTNTITWPDAVSWNGNTTPTLLSSTNARSTAAQVFILSTCDSGTNWYGYETYSSSPDSSTIWSWGRNRKGSTGQNYDEEPRTSSPIQIGSNNNWKNMEYSYLGDGLTATKTDGTLWSWGYNLTGQLGQNNRTAYSSPIQIPGTTWDTPWGSGEMAKYCVKTDGSMWAWGYNQHGALGLNTAHQESGSRSSPTQVPGTSWSTGRDKNAGGSYFCLSVKTDGTLWVWGNNGDGQLGRNNRQSKSSPTQIPGSDTTWNKVGAGRQTGFGIKTDGTLWGFGTNSHGVLGDNSPTSARSSAVQIPGTTWSSIDSGYRHTGAIKTDGTLWMWGEGTNGALAQNNQTHYSSPRQVPGTTWSQVQCGREYTLAVKTDGTAWGWGQNQLGGNLGLNNQVSYSSPAQIPGTNWELISAAYAGTFGFQNYPI